MLEASDLKVQFGAVTVVLGVDVVIPDGPYGVGLVGESGSGKTSVARAMLRLIPATSGRVTFDHQDVLAMPARELRSFRRAVQVVLQDPDGSLDPRMKVGQSIREVLRSHHIVARRDVAARVDSLLQEVGLGSEHTDLLPRQLSGGQRQRVSIARALAVQPRVLVLDEPTSAIDVTAQARILALIERLRADRSLAYLLISHNLAVVEHLCEMVIVLYLGAVVERGPTNTVFARPAHPYTAALRSAVPRLEQGEGRASRILLPGTPPDPANPPTGCAFHPRCPIAIARCATEAPALVEVSAGRFAACHRAAEVLAESVDLRREVGEQRAESPGGAENGATPWANSGVVTLQSVRGGPTGEVKGTVQRRATCYE
jgi:oligopeptide/dipeptide ABC transporter ATP-binding protein